MKAVFKALQSDYKKADHRHSKGELEDYLDRIPKNLEKSRYWLSEENIKKEFKKSCFWLGSMNILINMNNPHAVFAQMKKNNTEIPLFTDKKTKQKAFNACNRYLQELNKEYLEGNRVFSETQNAVKAFVQKSQPGTTVNHWTLLYGLIFSPIKMYFVRFQKLFNENVPTAD